MALITVTSVELVSKGECKGDELLMSLQKRNEVLKDTNKDVATTTIVEGNTIRKSKRQLSQIIDTTLLKCYILVKKHIFSNATFR